MLTAQSSKLEPLAEELKKEEPKVVVVVGAGVSIGATSQPQASWDGLLKHGIEHAVNENKLPDERETRLKERVDEAFSSPFDLENALWQARYVKDSLKDSFDDSRDFGNWLETAFSDFTIQPGEGKTLAAIHNLHQTGALLMTTNYDNLLTDETGLPPVTWRNPKEFLQAVNRDFFRILHIHGHWTDPDSVVLGKDTYDEITEDEEAQGAFKTLWLNASWLFVGCGNGLDDPNFSSLMEWRTTWEGSAPRDYFLAKADEADELAAQPEKPDQLVCVGYEEHTDIPDILNSLTPAARLEFFVPVDETFSLFRSPGTPDRPFPSRKEYLDGDVPGLEADQKVRRRLGHHGWVFIRGRASVGKTTLALRVATSERDRRVFYLDMSNPTLENKAARGRAANELRKLSRTGAFLIVDNIHHHPGQARSLLKQWRKAHSAESRLLLVATRMPDRGQNFSKELSFFEDHDTNPPVKPRPTPEYLGRVMKHLYARFESDGSAVPDPPPDVLQDWHRKFRSTLSAFCYAVFKRLSELEKGNWELPREAASDWVQEKWLDNLDRENRQNVLTLAVFSAQEVGLEVSKKTLPHPGSIRRLLKKMIGIVERTKRGKFSQYSTFHLLDPSSGPLIVSAQPSSVDEKQILYEAAARDPMLATYLISRLEQHGFDRKPLWDAIERNIDQFAREIWETPLSYVANFFKAARHHDRVINPLWTAIVSEPEEFADHALAGPLNYLIYFLNTAQQLGKDTDPLWDAIANQPEEFADRALAEPLVHLANYLDAAQEHGRESDPLWDAIASEPEEFAVYILEHKLDQIAGFLNTARELGQKIDPLKVIIENKQKKFSERVLEPSLFTTVRFLDAVGKHDQDRIWDIVARSLDYFTETVWEYPLDQLAHLFDAAQKHGRYADPLWTAVASEPEEFADYALEWPLGQLANFLNTAEKHGRDTDPLWDAIASEPEEFAVYILEHKLDQIAGFLNTAREQNREIDPLCEVIEKRPQKLSTTAKRSSISALSGFCRSAPTTLIEVALADFQTDHWDKFPPSEPMVGGTWVASACASIGREDLKSALVTKLLRRANPQDFPVQGSALRNIACLLKNVSSMEDALVSSFVDALCTEEWLRQHFLHKECGPLASGLRMLGLHQPLWIRRRFLHGSLGTRLQNELHGFDQAPQEEQSRIVQLLGSAALCGWDVKAAWFEGISIAQISRLPVETLPHRSEAVNVENWQFQLWLGLHTVARVTKKSMNVPAEIIDRTLDLWKKNLSETADKPNSPAYRVNQRMVNWLKACSQNNQGPLQPPQRSLQ